ncbi:hypothetical protein [Pseudonocardia sp. HH130629-09]|uniref:hypothetical protein n=1 Tax=Pseudonocardia sp. HH130629-09 TaxID=1641402 RepID=UPI0011AEBB44|nr:hypothetical protein [Pseudonocardia sp. HH130629-09]
MGQTRHRSNKLQRLVDDFAQTCRHRGIEVSLPVIEHGLRDRIDTVAHHMGVTSATALRRYFDDSWGREMAEQFCVDVEAGHARLADAADVADAVLPVAFLGRLVAALGQAQLFAAVNTDPHTTGPHPADGAPADSPALQLLPVLDTLRPTVGRFEPWTAAEANTGLGLALRTAGRAGLEPDEAQVPGRVLAQTREVLEDFTRRLQPGPGQWRACRCDGPCAEQDTPTQVRDAVRSDLDLLHLALDHHTIGQTPAGHNDHHDSDGDGGARVLRFMRSPTTEQGLSLFQPDQRASASGDREGCSATALTTAAQVTGSPARRLHPHNQAPELPERQVEKGSWPQTRVPDAGVGHTPPRQLHPCVHRGTV